MGRLLVYLVLGFCFWGPALSLAGLEGDYTIVIKDHQFSPAQLTVSAGKKIKLVIDNQDPSPEEFESYDLDREKIIGGGKQALMYIGPLQPGTYTYEGEFNPETAQGTITAE